MENYAWGVLDTTKIFLGMKFEGLEWECIIDSQTKKLLTMLGPVVKPEISMGVIEEDMKKNPSDPLCYCRRAVVHLQKRYAGKALLDLQKAIEIEPKEVRFYVARSIIEILASRLDDALGSLALGYRQTESRKELAVICNQLAILHFFWGNKERAKQFIKGAINADRIQKYELAWIALN